MNVDDGKIRIKKVEDNKKNEVVIKALKKY
jgi:hypothetical protein